MFGTNENFLQRMLPAKDPFYTHWVWWPDADAERDVGQDLRVGVDLPHGVQRNLRPLHSVLFPARRQHNQPTVTIELVIYNQLWLLTAVCNAPDIPTLDGRLLWVRPTGPARLKIDTDPR